MKRVSHPTSETSAASTASNSQRWQWIALLLLGAIGVAIYHNSFAAPLVFDGESHILRNPAVRQVWPWLSSWRADHADGGNRPVGFLTFALNHAWGGYNVRGYHAVNLLIHLAAAWLLFDIARRTLSGSRVAFDGLAAWGMALAIALVWMAHPLQTSSVTYVYQRLEALMGLFYLATLWCFVKALRSPRRGWWFAASVACCALGMATKEVMVTAPVIVLWYDRVFAARSWRELFRERGKYYLALAGSWAVLAWLMLTNGDEYSASGVLVVDRVTPLGYASSEPAVILHYLRLAFWPDQLCLDYGWPVATEPAQIVPPALVIGTLVALTAWAAYRWPACGFLGGCFFLILAPTSSVAPLADLAFEHRMYLPLAAVAALVVLGGHAVWRRVSNLRGGGTRADRILRMGAPVAAVSAVVATLGYFTVLRNDDYRTDFSIWQDTVQKRPQNARAYNGLGGALLDSGDLARAFDEFKRAIDLDPGYANAWFNLGVIAARQGEHARAIKDFSHAIDLMIDFPRVYAARGKSFAELGQHERAVADFAKAIQQFPNEAEPYYLRGTEYAALGREAPSMVDLNHAVELAPRNPRILTGRGIAYQRFSKVDHALADFDRAIELAPRFVDAYYHRALAQAAAGKPDLAIDGFTKVIELAPGSAPAYSNRGAAHAQMQDYARAVQDYSRAIELDPHDPRIYFNRASAYARQSKFDEATQDYERALELKPDYAEARRNLDLVHDLVSRFQTALDRYSQAIEHDPRDRAAYLGRADTYVQMGQRERAIEDLTKLIELDPADVEAYNSRGNLQALSSNAESAEADYGKVIELKPDFAAAYYNRAVVRNARGRYPQAIADCDKAIQLEPKYAAAYRNRARIESTCPEAAMRNGAQAVADATRACELTEWKVMACVDTLAAAYAEQGDFRAAVDWQTKALALQTGDDSFRRAADERLQLYRAKKPYREPPAK